MTKYELKAARKALGMSQDSFADALGYNSGRYIRDLESGQRTVTKRAKKIVNNLLKGLENVKN